MVDIHAVFYQQEERCQEDIRTKEGEVLRAIAAGHDVFFRLWLGAIFNPIATVWYTRPYET